MTIFLFTIFAAIAALAGGYVAIKSRNQLHIAMSITSGLVLGVVAFDLLPEIFEGSLSQGIDTSLPMALFIAGFLFFHVMEKFILVHQHVESEYGPHSHPNLGVARAVALIGHSFLDGLSIGVGFQVSSEVGTAVALAVTAHRFADGFDTASFMLFHKNRLPRIKKFLGLVVFMPILGGLTSLLVDFSETTLTLYLGFFAGLLMYVAAGNILPQAHAKNSSYKTIFLTILGATGMFIITRLA